MTITAKVIADSVNAYDSGSRIITLELRYPRFIHSEFMTHRVFSRNASSSRAIPIKKMIEQVKMEPAMPVRWGINGKGMQDHGEMSSDGKNINAKLWLKARDEAIKIAEKMLRQEEVAHKQIINRILEPWMHINVLVTSTQWNNFFHLRHHKDAQPEIKQLAQEMLNAITVSVPTPKELGQWHTPYVTAMEKQSIFEELVRKDPLETKSVKDFNEEGSNIFCKLSTARCARVSYLTHDKKKPSRKQDLALYKKLIESNPKHASPAEHQAMPSARAVASKELTGNFDGWVQYRKTLANENLEYDRKFL